MLEVLHFILVFFFAFTVSHYSLVQVWKNSTGCLIVAAVFAVLVALLLPYTLAG